MQRINRYNQVLAIVILAVVGSVAAYGYFSLTTSSSLSNSAKDSYAWYVRYRNLQQLVAGELNAKTWQDAQIAQLDVSRTLHALQRLAKSSPDRETIAALLRAQQRSLYATLSVLAGGAEQKRLVATELLDQRLAAMQKTLEMTMIGIGLFGLVVAELATQLELRRLRDAVRRDSLTSLGNHSAFREDLSREISRSLRHGHAMTVALIDVDDFKSVNDGCGHVRGDAALVATARALENGRREDRAYRTGGDEFALLLTETEGAQARLALERFREDLQQRPGTTTVSIGFCQLEKDFDDHDLLERADAALYAAKRNGRDTIVDFASIRKTTTIFSAQKAASLHLLLEDRALTIAFQPIWDVCGKHILGFEALARPNPSLGFSGPQEAFDVAEAQRRVADLDRLCIEKTLDALWGMPRTQLVFINVTPETLTRGDFQASALAAAAEAVGLQPRQIAIEVTERRITDTNELVRCVRQLRRRGFLVALDDTGAGHAGLEILRKATFDFVKIDRSVVLEAMVHRRARGVISGIIAIAREGDSFVIAEGIENLEQYNFLQSLQLGQPRFGDIAGIQGFLLGTPRAGRPDVAGFEEHGRILTADDPPPVIATA
jgi:diguanylate cyclase (GGDEF)-like protein